VGGMFLVWRDQRRGATFNDLYGTHLQANGVRTPGWPVDGKPLSQTGDVSTPYAVADAVGGLLVLWFDRATYQPRMQSVDGTGGLRAGFPADGMILPITVGGPGGYNLRAVPDGAGGVYVQWNSETGVYDALRVARVSAAGGFA